MGNIDGFGQYKIGGSGSTPTLKQEFILNGLLTNWAARGFREFIDWSGTLDPLEQNNSALPILTSGLVIKKVAVKYLFLQPASVTNNFTFRYDIGKLTDNSGQVAASNFETYTGGTGVITQSSVNTNNTNFFLESNELNIAITNGDILCMTGVLVSGTNEGADNEDVMVSVLLEKTIS
tara:strand:- start:9198 stop:9731 length:534 start_codon:yes stop_codon:yes gene_type:complete